MTIDFWEGAFHKGLIRLSKSFQIIASQMIWEDKIWEDKYIEDKISDEKIRKNILWHETTMKIEMEWKTDTAVWS